MYSRGNLKPVYFGFPEKFQIQNSPDDPFDLFVFENISDFSFKMYVLSRFHQR